MVIFKGSFIDRVLIENGTTKPFAEDGSQLKDGTQGGATLEWLEESGYRKYTIKNKLTGTSVLESCQSLTDNDCIKDSI